MLSLRRLLLPRRPLSNTLTTPSLALALFSTTTTHLGPKPLPPRPTILEADITEAFLKGTGPGGQKINKTSSAVQLKHLPTGIVIKCQETRSRSQNRKIARRILAERVEDLVLGDASRSALKADREKRKKASKNKKARRKYKKLGEQGKEGDEEEDDDDGEDNLVEDQDTRHVKDENSAAPAVPTPAKGQSHDKSDTGVAP